MLGLFCGGQSYLIIIVDRGNYDRVDAATQKLEERQRTEGGHTFIERGQPGERKGNSEIRCVEADGFCN